MLEKLVGHDPHGWSNGMKLNYMDDCSSQENGKPNGTKLQPIANLSECVEALQRFTPTISKSSTMYFYLLTYSFCSNKEDNKIIKISHVV